MVRNPNIAVIKIGYNFYAMENTADALKLMELMGVAIQVDEETYSLRNITSCTHFLAESSEMPELKFVPVAKFSPNETVKEAKARFAREQKEREDIEQHLNEAPAQLAAPVDNDPL